MIQQDKLKEIGRQIVSQDNCCTRDPMFTVQVRKRMYGLDPQWTGEPVWIDTEDGAREIPAPKDEAELEKYENNGFYEKTGFYDHWETVATCFTRKGCEAHLELNGHNYRHFEETRIYVECFHRNPEMLLIREYLIGLAKS